jgi:hypothetical protein
MAAITDYEKVLTTGWNPKKILAGQITSSANGHGFVPYDRLNQTISELRRRYGEIGGIMGWEYFNSQPGGLDQPWQWAQVMTAILRPNEVPFLTVTRATANKLVDAWRDSVLGAAGAFLTATVGVGTVGGVDLTPTVDYLGMVNA